MILLSFALTVPVLLGKQKLDLRGKSIKPLLLLGSMEPCIYFIGEQYGLKYSSSAFSGIMIAVIPIVTIIFAAIFSEGTAEQKAVAVQRTVDSRDNRHNPCRKQRRLDHLQRVLRFYALPL